MSNDNWEKFTPPEPTDPDPGAIIQYDLEMYVDAGAKHADKSQSINITRDEFIALKCRLAWMRAGRREVDIDDLDRLNSILKGLFALSIIEQEDPCKFDASAIVHRQIGIAADLCQEMMDSITGRRYPEIAKETAGHA